MIFFLMFSGEKTTRTRTHAWLAEYVGGGFFSSSEEYIQMYFL